MATSRDLVHQTLAFQNPPRAPRQLWVLPWGDLHHAADVAAIREAFPEDLVMAPELLRDRPATQGDPTEPGLYTDAWGSTFENIQRGVIGEVKQPLVADWTRDRDRVHVPREQLTLDTDAVNRFCGGTDQFVLSPCLARPFEQLQFLRGTAALYVDLMMEEPAFLSFVDEMHAFYCALLEVWAETEADALFFMDDWGSQQSLLIDPEVWRRRFKPLYRDYIAIAHGAGKKAFMHSDGHIAAIYPDLVELGLDAVNSQVFCMGPETLAPYAGRITFWGEVDRQHILPEGTVEEVSAAVTRAHAALWRDGGCIAQCEFGPGARPENVREVFAAWDRITRRA